MKHLIAWWQSRQQAKARQKQSAEMRARLLRLAIGRATDHGRAML